MELCPTGNPDASNPVIMSMLEYLASKGCEIVATRNILHVSKLQEFEDFLETKGYMIVETSKNPYEVLRAQKDGDTVIIYKKKDAKEHLSTMDKDYHLMREFIKSQRKQNNADRIRSMSDEELVGFLMNFDTCTHCDNSSANECTYETCEEIGSKCLLEWLKQPVED